MAQTSSDLNVLDLGRAYAADGNVVVRWLRAIRRFARRQPVGAAAAGVLVVFGLAAIFAPIVAPYGSSERDPLALLAGSSVDHWFGTDQLGRDTLSRVIYGARLTLGISVAATVLSTVIGLTVGVVAGYFGGVVDRIIGVIIDSIMAFPQLVLAIAMVTALGPSAENVVIAIVLPSSARFARVIRSDVLRVRSMLYIEAAHSAGCSSTRTLVRYVVPNIMAPVIVLSSLNLPAAILAESGLSFLGLGPPPPDPSWGRMLVDEGQQFFRSAPWLVIWPGLAITLVVYGFNLFGDALRDYLDPRLRNR